VSLCDGHVTCLNVRCICILLPLIGCKLIFHCKLMTDQFKLTKISKISFIGNSSFCDTVNLTTTVTVKSQTYVNPWFDISGVSCEK